MAAPRSWNWLKYVDTKNQSFEGRRNIGNLRTVALLPLIFPGYTMPKGFTCLVAHPMYVLWICVGLQMFMVDLSIAICCVGFHHVCSSHQAKALVVDTALGCTACHEVFDDWGGLTNIHRNVYIAEQCEG